MAAVPTGMVAFRLADVPEKIRVRVGRRLYEQAVADKDMLAAVQMHAAMYDPSDDVHWMPRAAYEKVIHP